MGNSCKARSLIEEREAEIKSMSRREKESLIRLADKRMYEDKGGRKTGR